MFEVMVEMRLILGPVGLELCGTQNLPGQQIWTATDIEVDQHRDALRIHQPRKS